MIIIKSFDVLFQNGMKIAVSKQFRDEFQMQHETYKAFETYKSIKQKELLKAKGMKVEIMCTFGTI